MILYREAGELVPTIRGLVGQELAAELRHWATKQGAAVAFERPKGSNGQPDVILVDTTWSVADFLAYQLAKRGINLHAFTPSLRRPRYLRAAYPYRSYVEEPLASGPSDSFLAMVERINPACIIPCTEDALYWIWDQPDHIQARCLSNVAPEIRPLLLDRALLLEEAAAWGVSTPTSMPLNDHDDCHSAIAAGLPLMVKAGRSIGSYGVALCRTPDEVISAFEKFLPRGTSVTAQRYYTGPTYLAGALFVNGEAVHFYAAEKTVMWPPLTGYSYELQTAAEPYLSSLLQSTETVCKNLGWTGLASFDFVLDEDGHFRFVDFNPRLWGSADALLPAKVDPYSGLANWIRSGVAGPPSRSIPGIWHRVFPKYTFEPSDMSSWRRAMGLRDAPWSVPSFVLGEVALEFHQRATRYARVRNSKMSKTKMAKNLVCRSDVPRSWARRIAAAQADRYVRGQRHRCDLPQWPIAAATAAYAGFAVPRAVSSPNQSL
jgi:hypothetical protein